MEEDFGSRGVLKKKSSSGCLIIKKKDAGLRGIGSSSDLHKERKRSKLLLSDRGSSDESLDPIRREVSTFDYGSTVNRKNSVLEMSNFGRNSELERERKRSRFNLCDFDEYDNRKMRNSYMVAQTRSEARGEFTSGSSSKDIVYKRRRLYSNNASDLHVGIGKRIEFGHKSDTEDEETHMPTSSMSGKFWHISDSPIRLQGKNGVLKVTVNKRKQFGLHHKYYEYQEAEGRKVPRSQEPVKKNVISLPALRLDMNGAQQPVPYARLEDTGPKRMKSFSNKCEKVETGEAEAALRLELGSSSREASGSVKKRPKNEESSSLQNGIVKPIRGKVVKSEKGSGTEKQLLREQIRNILVNAGWTIDYRPRRNRDYLDAVYINPTGTAFWSIIKAYEAFQKQLGDENTSKESVKNTKEFLSLSQEILSKLTRRTRKKMEKEMKKKKTGFGVRKIAEETAVRASNLDMGNDQHEHKPKSHLKQNGESQRGRSCEVGHVMRVDSIDEIHKQMPRRGSIEERLVSNANVIQSRKSSKIGRCTLLVRNSGKAQNSESSGFVPYSGRRTLLAWLIDSGTVQLSEKVQYMNRRQTKVLLEGWITRDGIHCGCCSKILTVSKFELHAGTKQRQPFQNIFLESGNSLLQCQIDAWNRQEESERLSYHHVDVDGDDPDDDTCGLCGDGGDLICCDGCPSTFHKSCLGMEMLPSGDWCCPSCACKFCGIASRSIANQISETVSSLQICSLCEKKYHISCSLKMGSLPADSSNVSVSFCGNTCQQLFDRLQMLIGVKHELEGGFSWSLIHRSSLELDMSPRSFPQRVECNSKVVVALSILDECFIPIFDRRSGINILHNVLYSCGSNFGRLNYSGFYTVVLERGDELISAASIRFHGIQLVEMPFIGTRHIFRRQGMCTRLLCAIESVLSSLKIKKLIIPAIAELAHTWTTIFGFHLLEESDRQEMRFLNMLVFPGIDMLQKLLVKQKNFKSIMGPSSDVKFVDMKEKRISSQDSAKVLGRGHHIEGGGESCHVSDFNGKIDPVETASETPSPSSVDGWVEKSAKDSTMGDNIQSDRKGFISGSLGSTKLNKNQNPGVQSTFHDTCERDMRCSDDLKNHLQNKLLVESDVTSRGALVGHIQRSTDGSEADGQGMNVKGFDSVCESMLEISAESIPQGVTDELNTIFNNTCCETRNHVVPFNS